MRSYSSLLVFETVFDSIQDADTDSASLARHIFYPQVEVVEQDCGTHLGETIDLNFEAEGRVELATGLPLSRDRITQLLGQGVYSVQIRTLSTCNSVGGVCAKCYAASRPLEAMPAVGSLVTIRPIYEKSTEIVFLNGDSTKFPISLTTDSYDFALVYINGQLQDTSTYFTTDTTLTFSTAIPAKTNIVVRYFAETKSPFMLWLADSYSGSLLGMKALPSPLLPIKSLLLTTQVPEGILQIVLDKTKKSTVIPPNMLEYLDTVPDNLEKALFLIALRSIFSNVQP
ncbi:MAG TPA: hypothetical protein VFM18_02735 [Methanosarcina sp.]|nr:hypothetical protein [Methanosarcina sp.]